MNPLLEQLKHVESELKELRRTADHLGLTVSELKKKIEPPVQVPEPPLPTPPPLPTHKVPVPATLAAPKPLEAPSPPPESVPAFPPDPTPPSQTRNLEMQLGRVWSVRLGIVLLTTGFVFLSRYTYDTIIRDLGPGLRLTFMYLLSFLLTGAGLFCERWKESLKSYGRIVAAGGLSAIYYCGFAAHNVEALRVIESPVAASILLFASAALFCSVSLWRKSRVMLSTSLALAFYSISVNPIGWMACLSALILGAFGIAMMLRHRWIEVGFLVLGGSYLSYLWWQFAVHPGDHSLSHWFLPSYWLLFAVASLSPGQILHHQRHILFTSINHTAFFLLFSFRLDSGDWMEKHWLFCFIFGAALLTLSFLGRKTFPPKALLLHLVKGISVITLGLSILLNGHDLFVALLLEALVLMIISLKFPNPLTIVASWITATLSLVSLQGIAPSSVHPSIWLIGVIAWVALGIMHRRIDQGKEQPVHPAALIASIIALILLSLGLMGSWDLWNRALTLGGLGMIAATLSLLPRFQNHLPETLATFVVGALLALGTTLGELPATLPQTLTAAILALLISIPLSITTRKTPGADERLGFHLITAAFLALSLPLIFFSLELARFPDFLHLALILAIPISGTLVAGKSKLLAHSIVPFAMYFTLIEVSPPSAPHSFFISLVTAGHFFLIQKSHRLPDRDSLKTCLFLIASFFWGMGLVKGLDSPGLSLALTAIALFIASPWLGKQLTLLVAIPYFLLGVLMAEFSGSSPEVYLCLFSLLALHLVRTCKDSGSPLTALVVVTLLALWAKITEDAGSAPLAAVWAVTGTVLLLTGLGLKSRCFRLIGLIVLAFSLGHLMIIDVVKLDPLPRILSFMTLGLGLLGLGFVYNRWQDRLKQIL